MPAPGQEKRKECWDARDGYFKCLDTNNEDKSKCMELRKAFEKFCSSTWVKYFDRRRDYLRFREKVEKEGFEPAGDKTKA